VLQDYKHVLLIHGDELSDIRGIVGALEKEIFLDGFHKAFAMAAGPCELCAECAEYCRHTEKARPAMEACGIDVYSTVRANGYPIKVVRTEDEAGNYYGIVLIE
jgi:predicted metal-binding protein